MRRIFYAPRLLNRQKPGSFVYNPKTMNGDDDRLAHLRDVEQKGGTAGLRKVRSDIGESLYHQVLNHKKENYA